MYEIDKVSYLHIGRQGENQSVTIELDMTSWADEHPDASFAILFKPYNEDLPSPVLTTYAEPILTWVVSSAVTQNVGVGYTEIRAFSAGGLIKKSKVIPTSVERSVSGGSSTTPPAYADWVNNVLGYKEAAETAQEAAETAQEAAEAAQEAAETAAESVVNSSVRYDTAQTLNDTQKETARENIGACSQSDADDLTYTKSYYHGYGDSNLPGNFTYVISYNAIEQSAKSINVTVTDPSTASGATMTIIAIGLADNKIKKIETFSNIVANGKYSVDISSINDNLMLAIKGGAKYKFGSSDSYDSANPYQVNGTIAEGETVSFSGGNSMSISVDVDIDVSEISDARKDNNNEFYDTVGDAIRGQISDIENLNKYALFETIDTSIAKNSAGSSYYYINQVEIKKGDIISYVDYMTNDVNGSVKVGIFEASTFKCIDIIEFSKLTKSVMTKLPINKSYSTSVYIGFCGPTAFNTYTPGLASFVGCYKVGSDASIGNIPTVQNESAKLGFFISVYCIRKYTPDKYSVTVDKNGFGDFTTINNALKYAYNTESVQNPVIIKIKPGIYNEVVNVGGTHHISLIGEDRERCIIQFGSGKYADSPIRIDGDAVVENLTIRGTMNDAGSFLPTDQDMGCYAIHIDDGAGYDTKRRILVKNCYLYSEAQPAAGCGLHTNQEIWFEDCIFETNISDSVNASAPNRSAYGALFVHGGGTEGQKLVVKNCVIHSNRSHSVRFDLGGIQAGLYSNHCYDDVNGATENTFTGTMPALLPNSSGNNIPLMNYSQA